MHYLGILRKPAQILADEIDRITILEVHIEVVVTCDQLSTLLCALKGKEKVLALLRDNIPDLEDGTSHASLVVS